VPEETAASRLRVLKDENLIRIDRAPAHPELTLEGPAQVWRPRDPAPDFGSLSYVLQSRWNQHPVLTTCVSATAHSTNLFNGFGGRPPRQVERTHDIHLAAVFLLYLKKHKNELAGWSFEEKLRSLHRRKRERLPDVIFERRGSRKVVEFGGAYPKAKIEAFHAYCCAQYLPYEVW
jgi:hypothetical protein